MLKRAGFFVFGGWPLAFGRLQPRFSLRFLPRFSLCFLPHLFPARSAVFYHGFPGVGSNPILSVRTRIRSGRLQEPFIRTLGRWSRSRKARNRSLASGVFGRRIDPLPSFVRSRAAARSSAFRSGSPVFAARSCGRTGGGTPRSTARTAPRQWPLPGCSDGLLRCGGRSGGAQRGETDGGEAVRRAERRGVSRPAGSAVRRLSVFRRLRRPMTAVRRRSV